MKRTQFTLTITCDNEAFTDPDTNELGANRLACAFEVGRILQEVGAAYDRGDDRHDGSYQMYLNARDLNGNIVGTYRLAEVAVE